MTLILILLPLWNPQTQILNFCYNISNPYPYLSTVESQTQILSFFYNSLSLPLIFLLEPPAQTQNMEIISFLPFKRKQ